MVNKYKHYVYILIIGMCFTIHAQSSQELQRIKSEYDDFQKQRSLRDGTSNLTSDIDPRTGLPDKAILTPYISPLTDIKDDDELNNFGYDFFTLRDTVAFWENLPTPVNYLLGPGDELVISLWGETQLRQTYTISREGNIYDQKVGLLNLAGKNILESTVYLKEQFGRIYATLIGLNPSTFINVSLGDLRSINVNFVGQVNYPGIYPVHPFSTVITGLIQAGGVDISGSLRNIQIKRDGKLFTKVDLYKYFINGELPEKIQLRDQDIVVVPVKKSIITIDSAVVNPGIYEGAIGETIYDLIEYAGGPKIESSSVVSLKRIKPIEDRIENDIYENIYMEINNTKYKAIQNGDYISIRSEFENQQFVQLIGQVKVPGIYNYYEDMTFTDLIQLGGGFDDTTFLKSVYMSQAEIIRRDPTSRYEEIITIDLQNLLIDKNIFLQNLDRVVIHANLNYFERENIQILGEVNIPGDYPLIDDNESLKSLLNRAGGLSSKALDNGIAIYREKIYFENPPEDKNLRLIQTQSTNTQQKIEEENNKIKLAWEGFGVILMPGDSIIVKSKVGAVFVTGEVYNEGLVEFQEGKSIRYYLDSAGGINNYGNRNNVIVVYPNGITAPWRGIFPPKIIDGSTIVVYQKADITPFDATSFATSAASLLSSLVTILVLSQQLQQ